MSSKLRARCRRLIAVFFASVFAPLGLRHLCAIGRGMSSLDPVPTLTPAPPAPSPAPSTTRVRAKGTGPTPEAAFQSALDDALRQAVAAEVSAADWQRHG